MRTLELLAPAKNLECGKAAIDHGADAVYIGASRFGARAAAGNSVEDVAALCRYAHVFDAKVYVTVNTLLRDDEIAEARRLLCDLRQAGVDAVLIQDLRLLEGAQIPLHASTQTDNRSAEKTRWLRDLGFSRVVLARELSVSEIRAVHEAVPDIELEVFVHGALCVSYSGACYASQYCFHRSANRGECAQVCRMEFDLVDSDGRLIEHNRHLLSLKDLCLIDHLEELAEAGASSFKIEGRLKDIGYVKNVTAAYSERLNRLVKQHPDRYRRSSRGCCTYTFTPNLQKTFNRGYTTYFAGGRQQNIASFDTPKALGEFVGMVKTVRRDSFTVAGLCSFANGDGLCFFNADRHLEGFRVNRVEGNRLFPLHMPADLHVGASLYRNNDKETDRLLSRVSAERKIAITLSLQPVADGFSLSCGDVSVQLDLAHQTADKPQRDNIVRQLSKFGGTPYECAEVIIPEDFNYFIPSSQLAELRRMLTDQLMNGERDEGTGRTPQAIPVESSDVRSSGIPSTTSAIPVIRDVAPVNRDGMRQLMQCRHCIRYSLGRCVRHGGRRPEWREPLFLCLGDGRRFRLEFDCVVCQMNVLAVE